MVGHGKCQIRASEHETPGTNRLPVHAMRSRTMSIKMGWHGVAWKNETKSKTRIECQFSRVARKDVVELSSPLSSIRLRCGRWYLRARTACVAVCGGALKTSDSNSCCNHNS